MHDARCQSDFRWLLFVLQGAVDDEAAVGESTDGEGPQIFTQNFVSSVSFSNGAAAGFWSHGLFFSVCF